MARRLTSRRMLGRSSSARLGKRDTQELGLARDIATSYKTPGMGRDDPRCVRRMGGDCCDRRTGAVRRRVA